MTLTPTRLWKQMTAEQRRRAAAALWDADEAASEQKQAALLIAKQMKFRPKTVSGLDGVRKARYLASVPDLPEELVTRMLVLYHLAAQRPMMSAFLDALGSGTSTVDSGGCVTPDTAKSLRLSPHCRGTQRTLSSISTRCWAGSLDVGIAAGVPEVIPRVDADPRIRALSSRRRTRKPAQRFRRTVTAVSIPHHAPSARRGEVEADLAGRDISEAG